MKKAVSKMTLDRLGEITQSEFAHIRTRFDKVDEKFREIDRRLDLLEEEIRELKETNQQLLSAVKVIIENTTNDLRSRLDSFDRRLSSIEKSKK